MRIKKLLITLILALGVSLPGAAALASPGVGHARPAADAAATAAPMTVASPNDERTGGQ